MESTSIIYNPNLFVITGGPGVGKTTLIEGLRKKSFLFVEEVARQIIKEQISLHGDALPWKNKEKYASLMLQKSIDTFIHNKDNPSITFFDRGIPDTLAYINLANINTIPEIYHIVEEYRYNQTVFILPYWEEIYQTDSERKQSRKEAEETFHIMKRTYVECGYNPIEVPKTNNEKRVEFILSHIQR